MCDTDVKVDKVHDLLRRLLANQLILQEALAGQAVLIGTQSTEMGNNMWRQLLQEIQLLNEQQRKDQQHLKRQQLHMLQQQQEQLKQERRILIMDNEVRAAA